MAGVGVFNADLQQRRKEKEKPSSLAYRGIPINYTYLKPMLKTSGLLPDVDLVRE